MWKAFLFSESSWPELWLGESTLTTVVKASNWSGWMEMAAASPLTAETLASGAESSSAQPLSSTNDSTIQAIPEEIRAEIRLGDKVMEARSKWAWQRTAGTMQKMMQTQMKAIKSARAERQMGEYSRDACLYVHVSSNRHFWAQGLGFIKSYTFCFFLLYEGHIKSLFNLLDSPSFILLSFFVCTDLISLNIDHNIT